MRQDKAFTIIELLVAIAIIAVMVGLLFPAIGAVKRHAKQTESNTRVRGIIQSMIQSSESRRGFFPGFDGFSFTPDGVDTTGDSGPGQTAEARYWILLDGSYLDSDALISPQESKKPWPNLSEPTAVAQKRVTTENYSYAMTKIGSIPSLDPTAGANADDRYRREEWRNEQNPLAPIVTDRLGITVSVLPTPGVPASYISIHDGSSEGRWSGSIGRSDLSVEFSNTPEIPTRIAGYHNVDDSTTNANEDDDIFNANDGTGTVLEQFKNVSVTYRSANNAMGDIE